MWALVVSLLSSALGCNLIFPFAGNGQDASAADHARGDSDSSLGDFGERCLIAGQPVSKGVASGTNSCMMCDPARSATAWSVVLEASCWKVDLVAGSGETGAANGPASSATFSTPEELAVGPGGELYVVDSLSNRIRMVVGGMVSTFAGGGSPGAADGPANEATFDYPHGIAAHSDVVYVADWNNSVIRKIQGGAVSTWAGNGDYARLDGALQSASFRSPAGVAVSPDGQAVYVTESGSGAVRRIAGGQVTTITVGLNEPRGLLVDGEGAVWVVDHDNHRIVKIVGGKVTTVAGALGEGGYKDGPLAEARFQNPHGIALDSGGVFYVTDRDNCRVRAIHGGEVTTLAGADCPPSGTVQSTFAQVNGIILAKDGARIYVSDDSQRIWSLSPR